MSQYKNFIHDFPSRCREVLERSTFVHRDREVTLLLMAASSAFLVPFERLAKEHPAKDRDRFLEVAQSFDKLLKSEFIGSTLCSDEASSWSSGHLSYVDDDPDSWYELRSTKSLEPEKSSVKWVVTVIRHALAHGNIYTKGGKQISTIIFASYEDYKDKSAGFRFVSVSPMDFRNFLLQWFNFLEQNQVDRSTVSQMLEKAA